MNRMNRMRAVWARRSSSGGSGRNLFRSIRTYMSIAKCVSPFFKVREDLNRTGTARRILRSLRTLGSFSGRRAIDMQVLTDLKRVPFRLLRRARETRHRFDRGAFFCCLKQD